MADILPVNTMIAPAYEPLRQNRWVVQWEGLDAWTLKSFARPSFNMGENVVDYLNTKRYYQGKFEWQPISMTLYQPIVPSASQKVMEWVRLGFENISGRAGYKEFYTAKNFKVLLLDGPGAIVEQWSFINLFLTSVNFGGLDYATADLLTAELQLRYDICILER